MPSLIDMRRVAMTLFVGALLVAAVVPFCHMLTCGAMSGTLGSHTAGLAATCTALPAEWLPSGTVATSGAWTTSLQLVAAFSAIGLAMVVSGSRQSPPLRRTSSPHSDPLGVRILI